MNSTSVGPPAPDGAALRSVSEKLRPYPSGPVVVLPSGTPHFHRARSGDYVTQVTAIGPLGLDYVDPRTG